MQFLKHAHEVEDVMGKWQRLKEEAQAAEPSTNQMAEEIWREIRGKSVEKEKI